MSFSVRSLKRLYRAERERERERTSGFQSTFGVLFALVILSLCQTLQSGHTHTIRDTQRLRKRVCFTFTFDV